MRQKKRSFTTSVRHNLESKEAFGTNVDVGDVLFQYLQNDLYHSHLVRNCKVFGCDE